MSNRYSLQIAKFRRYSMEGRMGGGAMYMKSWVTVKFLQFYNAEKFDWYPRFHIHGAPPSAPPYYIVLILQFEHYIYLTFKKLHSYHVFWRLTSFLNVKPKIIDFWLFLQMFCVLECTVWSSITFESNANFLSLTISVLFWTKNGQIQRRTLTLSLYWCY